MLVLAIEAQHQALKTSVEAFFQAEDKGEGLDWSAAQKTGIVAFFQALGAANAAFVEQASKLGISAAPPAEVAGEKESVAKKHSKPVRRARAASKPVTIRADHGTDQGKKEHGT